MSNSKEELQERLSRVERIITNLHSTSQNMNTNRRTHHPKHSLPGRPPLPKQQNILPPPIQRTLPTFLSSNNQSTNNTTTVTTNTHSSIIFPPCASDAGARRNIDMSMNDALLYSSNSSIGNSSSSSSSSAVTNPSSSSISSTSISSMANTSSSLSSSSSNEITNEEEQYVSSAASLQEEEHTNSNNENLIDEAATLRRSSRIPKRRSRSSSPSPEERPAHRRRHVSNVHTRVAPSSLSSTNNTQSSSLQYDDSLSTPSLTSLLSTLHTLDSPLEDAEQTNTLPILTSSSSSNTSSSSSATLTSPSSSSSTSYASLSSLSSPSHADSNTTTSSNTSDSIFQSYESLSVWTPDTPIPTSPLTPPNHLPTTPTYHLSTHPLFIYNPNLSSYATPTVDTLKRVIQSPNPQSSSSSSISSAILSINNFQIPNQLYQVAPPQDFWSPLHASFSPPLTFPHFQDHPSPPNLNLPLHDDASIAYNEANVILHNLKIATATSSFNYQRIEALEEKIKDLNQAATRHYQHHQQYKLHSNHLAHQLREYQKREAVAYKKPLYYITHPTEAMSLILIILMNRNMEEKFLQRDLLFFTHISQVKEFLRICFKNNVIFYIKNYVSQHKQQKV